jgi:hypothetical protein
MDWNAQIGRELRGLDGIVAILLSLAGLAERAAGARPPVRWFVLWLLRHADAVATEYVAGYTCGAAGSNSPSAGTISRSGSAPADAIDLALSLSRLARAVAAIAAQLRRQAFLYGRQPSGGSRRDHGSWHGVFRAIDKTSLRVECPDTS